MHCFCLTHVSLDLVKEQNISENLQLTDKKKTALGFLLVSGVSPVTICAVKETVTAGLCQINKYDNLYMTEKQLFRHLEKLYLYSTPDFLSLNKIYETKFVVIKCPIMTISLYCTCTDDFK